MNTLPVRRQYSDGYRTENSLSTNIQVKKKNQVPEKLANIPGND